MLPHDSVVGDRACHILMKGIISRIMSARVSTLEKFHPPKFCHFPKHFFGSKGILRSFRAECYEPPYGWLHYDVGADAAYCHLCLSAEVEEKFLASTKQDPLFISWRCTNWNDAKASFNKHIDSACNKEAVQVATLPQATRDVGE